LVGADEEVRDRRLQAIALMAGYASLLQDATPGTIAGRPRRYCFKLVYPDGSWNVEEKALAALPRRGDVVSFGLTGRWRIGTSQSVKPRPAGKPEREFYVCAPALC
jgi:hypothetical protein